MKRNNSQFYQNKECEYFPCHKAATGDFNCLFCFCPLYALKDQCGGNYQYLDNGVKDCSACLIPHSEKGYEYIMEHMDQVLKMTKIENVSEKEKR